MHVPMPDGAIREGTLANGKLISDAKVGVATRVAILGCSEPKTIQKFVIAMPEGEVGARHWKEQWVIGGCGNKYPINIEFREDGANAAYWSILDSR